jgi:hypothetical protein
MESVAELTPAARGNVKFPRQWRAETPSPDGSTRGPVRNLSAPGPSRSFPRQHTLDCRQQALRDDAMANGIQMLPIE